jgi:hypothetical protein
MTDKPAPILRTSALASLVVGVILALGSWDGLYETLDLPQSLPAIGTQIGGVALVALAYLLWAACSRPELTRVAAATGAIAEGGAAVVIGSWLLFRERIDLGGIGGLGEALLIVTAVVFAALALAQARLALAAV